MNRYDELYNFRLAKKTDVDNIMHFLHEEWGKNHILANDKEFFIWMYGNSHFGDSDTINFVLMEDKKGNILGVNGFVPYSNENNNLSVSSAITKVNPRKTIPLSGVELIKRFREIVGAKHYYSYGTNPATMIPIGKKVFKYDVGLMQQYYMLNYNLNEYHVADIKNKVGAYFEENDYRLVSVSNIDELKTSFIFKNYDNQGYKSQEYINQRYFNHPIYKYDVMVLEDNLGNRRKDIVFIGREIDVANNKVYRIVDVLGDVEQIKIAGSAWQSYLVNENIEYVDLINSGITHDILVQAGFTLRREIDENIIPTYFEPFVRENINIWYQKSEKEIIIFKADGDQDRPNWR